MLFVVMVLVAPFVPFTLWMNGFLSGSLIPLRYWVTLLNRLLSVVGILGFVSGPIGFGRIWVLGLMPGFGRTTFSRLPFLSSRTL